jgi:hypothetical protein
VEEQRTSFKTRILLRILAFGKAVASIQESAQAVFRNWQFEPDDRWGFSLVCWLQSLLLAAILIVGYLVDDFRLPICVTSLFLVLSGVIDLVVWRDLRVRRRPSEILVLLFFVGISLMVFAGLLMSAYVLALTPSWSLKPLVGIALALSAVLLWQIALRPTRQNRAPWLLIGTMMVLVPLFYGWAFGSKAWDLYAQWIREPVTKTAVPVAAPPCPDVEPWLVAGERVRVALALSGGGYRAALVHAGLLTSLVYHCVPIDYVTAVSGGSIIGASYVLGRSPESFAAQLARGRPGLANDKLNFQNVYNTWFTPNRNDADIYAEHFDRSFFGGATLARLPDKPVLLINATDLEANQREAREVFFKERAQSLRLANGDTLDKTTKLADLVAASAAFPGAFGPKRIMWAPVAGDATSVFVMERKFIDGGVVENLGIQGLRRYLTLERPRSSPPPRPHILLVSDATLRSQGKRIAPIASVLSVLERAEGISYDALHEHLFSRYTEHPDYLAWMRDTPIPQQVSGVAYASIDELLRAGEPAKLWTVVLPLTAPDLAWHLGSASYSSCRFQGVPIAAVQREVGGFSTLRELERAEVEKAFWLGFALGEIYWPAIDCARGKVRDPLGECPKQHPEHLSCLSFPELIARDQPRSPAGR